MGIPIEEFQGLQKNGFITLFPAEVKNGEVTLMRWQFQGIEGGNKNVPNKNPIMYTIFMNTENYPNLEDQKIWITAPKPTEIKHGNIFGEQDITDANVKKYVKKEKLPRFCHGNLYEILKLSKMELNLKSILKIIQNMFQSENWLNNARSPVIF